MDFSPHLDEREAFECIEEGSEKKED